MLTRPKLWRTQSLCAFLSLAFGLITSGMWAVIWLSCGEVFLNVGGVMQAIVPLAFGIAGLYETKGGLKRGRWMAVVGTSIGTAMTLATLLSQFWD